LVFYVSDLLTHAESPEHNTSVLKLM